MSLTKSVIVGGDGTNDVFMIAVSMERTEYTVMLYRVVLPVVVVLLLAVFFFWLTDAAAQLELAFTALLVITLLGIEVKDMMPSWVDVRDVLAPPKH